MGRTLSSLVSGDLSPKYMGGPLGIMQIMHHSWGVDIREGIYWLGFISLNLGILNLLPIPVLDGGGICFALFEMITRRKLKAKTMERMILPFVVLLIGVFVYLTVHDISRFIWGA